MTVESSKSEQNVEEVYVCELADAVQKASSEAKQEVVYQIALPKRLFELAVFRLQCFQDSVMDGLNFRTGTEAILTRYSLETVKYENEVDKK